MVNPHELLKVMDYARGVLSYKGIELIRNIEKLAFGGEKRSSLIYIFLEDQCSTMRKRWN